MYIELQLAGAVLRYLLQKKGISVSLIKRSKNKIKTITHIKLIFKDLPFIDHSFYNKKLNVLVGEPVASGSMKSI